MNGGSCTSPAATLVGPRAAARTGRDPRVSGRLGPRDEKPMGRGADGRPATASVVPREGVARRAEAAAPGGLP